MASDTAPPPIPNPEQPVVLRGSGAAAKSGGTFIDANDGNVNVLLDEAPKVTAFSPRTFTKTDSTANSVTITDGLIFSITLSNVGDSVSIVSDGKTYTSTFYPGSTPTVVVPDGDYGDIVIAGGVWGIDSAVATAAGRALMDDASAAAQRTTLGLGTAALNATGDFDPAGAAAAAQAASLPLHGTADDSALLAGTSPSSIGLDILHAADAAAERTLLGLGTLATQSGTFSGTSSGTNTGDQTNISGNAATVTTNANLTGPVTSVGNATTIADAELAAIAGLTSAANKGITFTGSGTAATFDLTAAALTVLDDATVEAMLTTLGGGARTGSGVIPGKTSPAFTTPDIGAATGASLAASSFVTCAGQTGIGYAAGAGGSVGQGSGSGKATTVTLNNICGQITMDGAALAAAAEVSFTVNCNRVLLQDVIVVCHQSAGTFGAYAVHAGSITNATSFKIMVGNMSAGSLSEAIVLNYVILRGVKA